MSHILFADDTLVFSGAEGRQLRYPKLLLIIFETISGLHINLHKSVMYPVNTVDNMQGIAYVLGCNIGSLPTTYLGLHLGTRYKNTTMWQ